jgi:hypothetical protein
VSVTVRIEVIGEPHASPTATNPDGKRALVRLIEEPDAASAALGFRRRVTFGIARNQGPDGAWVDRWSTATLRAAWERFVGTVYP